MEFRNPESYSAWGARQTGRSREQDRDDVWGLALLWPQDPHTMWVILAKNPANTVGGRLVVKWIRSNNVTMPDTCFHLLRSLYLVLSASVECRSAVSVSVWAETHTPRPGRSSSSSCRAHSQCLGKIATPRLEPIWPCSKMQVLDAANTRNVVWTRTFVYATTLGLQCKYT